MSRRQHGWAVVPSIGVLLCIAVAGVVPTQAAGIAWQTRGPFTACLDGKAQAWMDSKVELVVNDDPAMGSLDDTAVAEWATQALKECAAKAPGADSASEVLFMKHMSR